MPVIDVDTQDQVMRLVVEHVSTSLGKGVILNIRDVVEFYQKQVESLGKMDDLDYKALRKLIKNRLEKSVPTIMFEDAVSNQPQRIVSKNMTKLLLYIAEKAEKSEVESSMAEADKSSTTLKEAA